MFAQVSIRRISILAAFVGMLFLNSGFAHAEKIAAFTADIAVQTDNSVAVSETIRYDSEGAVKHGIFRTIRTVSSEGKDMRISGISVTDAAGNAYQFDVQRSGSDVTLKIGDPNTTFAGERTYVIRYTASSAVAHLQDRDEIYWNATGNDWPFPIADASATISLPAGAQVLASACYIGPQGSNEQCKTDNGTAFAAGRTLMPGEGFTIATGFPQGIVAPYAPETWMHRNGYLLILLLPLLIFLIQFLRWYRFGRDPKGTGVIIPQYDVPENLTPMEVSLIVHQKNQGKDISAEIIYLATKGYLKIRQIETKTLGIFKSTDYELTLLKSYEDLQNGFDKELLMDLFGNDQPGTTVKLLSLKNVFYALVPKLFKSAANSAITKQHYKNLPQSNSTNPVLIVVSFLFLMVIFGPILSVLKVVFSTARTIPALTVSIIGSVIIFFIFQTLMPAKTEKGVALKEYILGLKEYLQIAEKDRLKFHNAPEKKPEIFELLLPYALVLGVENSWAKEFQDLYTVPPSWYEGTYHGTFNATAFTHSIDGFSTSTMSAFGVSPSGGSGGGGSSGGGGGGGGGGSW